MSEYDKERVKFLEAENERLKKELAGKKPKEKSKKKKTKK